MRTFTANFLAQCDLKSSTPYLVLEVDWGGTVGTKYYMDRDPATLAASGTRTPAAIEAARVRQWPRISLALKEGQVGATEQSSVELDDANHAVSDILNGGVRQRVIVAVWRLFDASTTVWPTDAALMFSGTLRPFDWTIKENKVTLHLGDSGPLLQRDISLIANSTTIPPTGVTPYLACPPESQDKNIPLGWGTAQRVEAVVIQRPFRTTITQPIDGSNATPSVQIADDPTAFGIPLGSTNTIGVIIGNQQATCYFSKNADGTYNANFTVAGAAQGPVIATANVTYSKNGGGQSYPTFANTTVQPFSLQDKLADVVQSGATVGILINNSSDLVNVPNRFYLATVQSLTFNDPWQSYYHLTISSTNSHLQNNISPGDLLTFYAAGPITGVSPGSNGNYVSSSAPGPPYGYTAGDLLTPNTPAGNAGQLKVSAISTATNLLGAPTGLSIVNGGWYTAPGPLNDVYLLGGSGVGAWCDLTFNALGAVIGPWPSGTPLVVGPNAHWVYAFNALPAKAVLKVEGYGAVQDASGSNRKDFVLLGQSVQQVNTGTVVVTSESFDYFTVNLNDSTWNATLGRHIATITFPNEPRAMANTLDDDRIWVSYQGVEDVGDSTGNLISNPATVVLQYLENQHLMNVNAGSINAASFTAAASALAGYSIGFAQIEAQRGLELLQDIARQCHSVLFFDQGQAQMTVLANSAGSTVELFSTQAADGVNDNILLGSIAIAETPADDVVNQVVLKWRSFWDDKTGNKPADSKNTNLNSVAAFSLQSREIPVYIFYRRADVATERDFWLTRWTDIWRTVKFTTFHQALKLQAGDWITVTVEDPAGHVWFTNQAMLVTRTVDTGKGLVEVEAKYVFQAY